MRFADFNPLLSIVMLLNFGVSLIERVSPFLLSSVAIFTKYKSRSNRSSLISGRSIDEFVATHTLRNVISSTAASAPLSKTNSSNPGNSTCTDFLAYYLPIRTSCCCSLHWRRIRSIANSKHLSHQLKLQKRLLLNESVRRCAAEAPRMRKLSNEGKSDL